MFESRRPDTSATTAAGSRLVIGDLRADETSLVACLVLARAGVEVAVETIDPAAQDRAARVAAVSPTSRLPVLVEHGTVIWEPLAILEWAVERAPGLWPAHARRRAVARAIVAELHGGLAALRAQLPFDWFARYRLRDEAPAGVQVDLHRLARIWGGLLEEDGGGFLFGPRPGLADLAMVPMAARLRTYDLWPRRPLEAGYAERLLALPELAELLAELPPEPAVRAPTLAVPIGTRTPEPAAATATPVGASTTPASGGGAATDLAEPPASRTATARPPAPSRKLEEIVARARQRDRDVPRPAAVAADAPAGAAGPSRWDPPASPPPPRREQERPASSDRKPSPPTAPPWSARAPAAAAAADGPPSRETRPAEGTVGEPVPPTRDKRTRAGADERRPSAPLPGLGWLRRRREPVPPGGGRRRRPGGGE